MPDKAVKFVLEYIGIKGFKNEVIDLVQDLPGKTVILIDEHVHDQDLQIGIYIFCFGNMLVDIGMGRIKIGNQDIDLII